MDWSLIGWQRSRYSMHTKVSVVKLPRNDMFSDEVSATCAADIFVQREYRKQPNPIIWLNLSLVVSYLTHSTFTPWSLFIKHQPDPDTARDLLRTRVVRGSGKPARRVESGRFKSSYRIYLIFFLGSQVVWFFSPVDYRRVLVNLLLLALA